MTLRHARTVALMGLTLLWVTPTVSLAASPPAVAAVNNFPVVQGGSYPLGDLTVAESAPGQLPTGDVITFRFADSAAGATLHFNTNPSAAGTNGLTASLTLASSSGTLNDEVLVTIQAVSSASPGVLTLTGLTAAVDAVAAIGNDVVNVGDSAGVVAPVGSTVSTSDANVLSSVTPKALYAAVTAPTIFGTGNSQQAGNLTIGEPAKVFFKTGDLITFSMRDSQGTANTVGLTTAPAASGGSMTVAVVGLSSPTPQPNDTGFKVLITAQDPANGSTSTLTISNLSYNLVNAPQGPVTVSAVVTTGASTEYIVPGRVTNAVVGGNTATTSAGQPIIQLGTSAQPVANLTVTEAQPGTLKANDTFSLQIEESGVTYSGTPPAKVTSGNLGVGAGTLNASQTTVTYPITATSSIASTIVIGPIYYDVTAGATAGDPVNVLTFGSGASANSFTSVTVANARLAPTGASLFTPASAPIVTSTSGAAGNVVYQEAAGMLAPTNGSIVLLSPYADKTTAYRTTFSATPTATVAAGSGLVLGAGNLNTVTIAVLTPTGTISAPPATAAIFPVTTGSTTPASVTFSGISYSLGSLVPPGAYVGYGVVDSGSNGSGTSLWGNQYVNGASAGPPPSPPKTKVYSVVSNQQYFLSNSDGSTWADMDAAKLVLMITPSVDSTAVLSANADLWTENAGFNQDIGIYVTPSDATAFPANIVAWKESGGFAGTFSPNAAFVQTAFQMTGGTTYTIKIRWKTNKSGAATIAAGAGSSPNFSPTRLTARVVPSGTGISSVVSNQQYFLSGSDGSTWVDMDSARLEMTVTPGVDSIALIGANADLWTENAGYNQDIGISVSPSFGYPSNIVAWKESGGFAGTFSPNAAFAQKAFPMSAGVTYTIKLQWKTNKSAAGATIAAAAGGGLPFSQTRLVVQLVPSTINPAFAVSTKQYFLANSNGSTWQDIDATNLSLILIPSQSCTAILAGNADLWTENAGYNQDIGITINGTLIAWKESGGFAGTFSPNAASVQTVLALAAGTTYTIKLQWKTNKPATGVTIAAAAGNGPTFSPTSLTVHLEACS